MKAKTFVSSWINDERRTTSAMLLTVRHVLINLETYTFKYDLLQYWSYSRDADSRFVWMTLSGRAITNPVNVSKLMSGFIYDLEKIMASKYSTSACLWVQSVLNIDIHVVINGSVSRTLWW